MLGLGLRAGMRLIFVNPTKIENGQRDLQCNNCIRLIMPSPSSPKDIAEKEEPEASFPLSFGLRRDQPRGKHCHNHRGPLQLMQVVDSGNHDMFILCEA